MNYFVHESAFIDEGAQIGLGSKIWHFSHIMSGAQVGHNCNIGQNVFIASKVKIGSGTKIQNNVSLYEGVICEEQVFIGPSAVFTNVYNPRSAVNRKNEYRKTIVRKGATIGANATIVCGNTIGAYAFIGAGSVIVKDVEDYALVVGNPSRQIGWMSRLGNKLEFDDQGMAICQGSGQKYQLKEGKVQLL